MSELALFILWEHARIEQDAILADLSAHFTVRVTVEIDWAADRFTESLTRFYGERLPSGRQKELHCGTGPFLVVVVEDTTPWYGLRSTPRGVERVNVNLFDAKSRFRAMTGGGHRVHGTNDETEFAHDAWLLLGIDAAEGRAGLDHAVAQQPLRGGDGWTTVSEALHALELTTPYVVLRNWQDWDEFGPRDEHPDIDLLVRSRQDAAYVLGATPTTHRPGRVQYEVQLGERTVCLDLRSPGDGYLPRSWASSILETSHCELGFRTPAPGDAYWSLLYHALVHKWTFADDYVEKLSVLAAAIDEPFDVDKAPGRLADYLESRDLRPSLPRDPSVAFNTGPLGAVRGWRSRQLVISAWNASRRLRRP